MKLKKDVQKIKPITIQFCLIIGTKLNFWSSLHQNVIFHGVSLTSCFLDSWR